MLTIEDIARSAGRWWGVVHVGKKTTQRVNWQKYRKLRNQEEEEQGSSRKSPPTKGKISKDRIEKLESIGIVWEPAVTKFKQQVLNSLDYRLNTYKVMPRSVETWVESTKKE